MKKLIVAVSVFLLLAVSPFPAKGMEVWEVFNTITEEVSIAISEYDGRPFLNPEPGILELREEVILNYNFRCTPDRVVCGTLPSIELSITPGWDIIRMEIDLSRGMATIPSPWGMMPVEVTLKTEVVGLSPRGLMEIITTILSAQEMTLILSKGLSMSSGYVPNPEEGGPPLNFRIQGWLRALFVMFRMEHEEEAIPDRG